MNREQTDNVVLPVYKCMVCLHLQCFVHLWSFCFRVKLEKVWTRAALLIKGVTTTCARNNEVGQDSAGWGRSSTEQE